MEPRPQINKILHIPPSSFYSVSAHTLTLSALLAAMEKDGQLTLPSFTGDKLFSRVKCFA